jgi:hypothetical protein|tara:strand:+ start:4847 stop:5347 length:501 start_codon:yes stop_codon:yes gene_type:complete
MDIISNCSLCEEHSLHVMGEKDAQMMQCLNCGYVSTSKFIGTVEDNEEYKNLTEDMQRWSKQINNRIWIPTIMTLPVGMLYPQDDENGEMKWYFARMVNIPKEQQQNYPIPGDSGKFYETMYDTHNVVMFDEFFEGMLMVNNKMKEEAEKQDKPIELKLPKLKKVD